MGHIYEGGIPSIKTELKKILSPNDVLQCATHIFVAMQSIISHIKYNV
jgi:hypothetical protein